MKIRTLSAKYHSNIHDNINEIARCQ